MRGCNLLIVFRFQNPDPNGYSHCEILMAITMDDCSFEVIKMVTQYDLPEQFIPSEIKKLSEEYIKAGITFVVESPDGSVKYYRGRHQPLN
jgi:hypothetical protein